jgi:hypothetical protein
MTATLDQLSSPRILRGTRADIWLATYLDGEPTAPATPAPTVSVSNQDGTVIASGTATISTENKRLEFTLTAAQTADANLLTATWSDVKMGSDPTIDATTYHEVCGDVLFTLPEARNHENGVMKNATTFPNWLLLEARDRIWDEFESILEYPLGGRVRRESRDGSGTTDLYLSAPASSVRVVSTRDSGTWTAFTSGQRSDIIVTSGGRLIRDTMGYWPKGTLNVRVTFEAGEVPIPRALKRAALLVLRDQMNKSDIPARATSQTSEIGTFQLSTPGQRGAEFGIPAVDVVLNRMRSKSPGFA